MPAEGGSGQSQATLQQIKLIESMSHAKGTLWAREIFKAIKME